MGRKLNGGELRERSKRLAAVVCEARRFAAAWVAGDAPGVRVERERLVRAVAALDAGPGSERRRRAAPPR